jgi:hypothetical protein
MASTYYVRPGESLVQGRAFDRLLRRAAEANKDRELHVGILSGRYPRSRTVQTPGRGGGPVRRTYSVANPPAVAQVGFFHEFGIGQQSRPFIGPGVRAAIPAIRAAVPKLIDPGTMRINDAGMQALGLIGKAAVQREIRNKRAPALSPRTVAMKGSSQPLLDRGILMRSVDFRFI